jgi:hypothetical protein
MRIILAQGGKVSNVHKAKAKLSKWWTLPPVIIILGFNIALQTFRPAIPFLMHFLWLIAASIISFGVAYVVAWLSHRVREPWRNS